MAGGGHGGAEVTEQRGGGAHLLRGRGRGRGRGRVRVEGEGEGEG